MNLWFPYTSPQRWVEWVKQGINEKSEKSEKNPVYKTPYPTTDLINTADAGLTDFYAVSGALRRSEKVNRIIVLGESGMTTALTEDFDPENFPHHLEPAFIENYMEKTSVCTTSSPDNEDDMEYCAKISPASYRYSVDKGGLEEMRKKCVLIDGDPPVPKGFATMFGWTDLTSCVHSNSCTGESLEKYINEPLCGEPKSKMQGLVKQQCEVGFSDYKQAHFFSKEDGIRLLSKMRKRRDQGYGLVGTIVATTVRNDFFQIKAGRKIKLTMVLPGRVLKWEEGLPKDVLNEIRPLKNHPKFSPDHPLQLRSKTGPFNRFPHTNLVNNDWTRAQVRLTAHMMGFVVLNNREDFSTADPSLEELRAG